MTLEKINEDVSLGSIIGASLDATSKIFMGAGLGLLGSYVVSYGGEYHELVNEFSVLFGGLLGAGDCYLNMKEEQKSFEND